MQDHDSGRQRCLLVGLDAACFPVVDPLLSAGELPNLASTLADGVGAPLRSQIPPWTPSAWPSIYTGMNPGKHGLFDFLAFDGYEWDVVDATHLVERPVWETLSAEGFASVVVNAPVTHPPRPFDGALIPGYTAPEDPTCHPDGLLEEVREAVGGYRVYLPAREPVPVEAYRRLVEMRGRAFRYLADRFDPDFGFVQFQVTDTVFHRRPGDEDAVRAIYREVDDQLGAIVDQCAPEYVLVASDHGMGEYAGYEFRVNEFLRREGYVAARRGGAGMPTWATIRDSRLKGGEAGERPDPGWPARLSAAAARLGLTTQRLVPVLDALNLRAPLARRLSASVAHAGEEQVDFPASRAYMRSRSELGVRVNLAGREPDGTVSPDDYEPVRSDLIDRLGSARTPEGDPVFETVAPREAYFWGPEADRAVDVVTVPAAFDQFLSARLAAEPFGPPSERWNHKREGLFAAAGPAVQRREPIDGATVFDVAPTVLAAFGLPRDERMDGQVLPIVEPAGSRRYPRYDPVRERNEERADVDPAMADRLEALGYVERP